MTTRVKREQVAKLRAHPDNPRKISSARLEQLKRSLEADPQMLDARPLIALMDGTVIAGNQRLHAVMELGWDTVPVAYVDLDAERAREWMIRDNRGYGEDDDERLAELLAGLQEAGRDLDLLGIDPSALDKLLRSIQPEPPVDPDDVPPLPDVPDSKLGEVYDLGRHRLMCGDATDASHVASLLANTDTTAVVTDPPYGIDREGVSNDDPETLRSLFDATLAAANISDCVWVAFQSARLFVEWIDATRSAGHTVERMLWMYRQTVVTTYPWRGWIMASDPIVVTSKGSPKWPKTFESYSHDTYVKVGSEDAALNGVHTTIKPAWIVADIVSKMPLGSVYDPFAGSGTTLIAAEMSGRSCYAMEIEPAYCDVIRNRYQAFTAS